MDKKRLVDGTTALAEKRPRVIKIEPAERPQNVRLRVAAYTRVSSDSEDQLNSFAAQNRYYTELISGKAEWRMVDIYADEGITGTSVAKRDDFQRMMADCRRGLIDQILVKSISRFARNTKDCLQNIRELKELGVNVRFEREGIDTVNVSSELITAIYAAFAQKESESISGMLSSMGTIRLFFFIHSRYKFFAIWQSQTEILLSPRKELIFIIARNIVSCVNSSDNVSSRDNESRKQYTVFPYS